MRPSSFLDSLARIRWLPAWLLACLLFLGLLLEGLVHATLLWPSKVPLALLLASLAWIRARRA